MVIYRATDTSVVFDDRVYRFNSKQEADDFERGLQDYPLAQCRIYFRPAEVHRCPAKLRPQIEILERAHHRKVALEKARNDRRQELIAARRNMAVVDTADSPASAGSHPARPVLLPFSLQGAQHSSSDVPGRYEGKHVCYVVHGHGGYIEELAVAQPNFMYRKLRMRFYCNKGETTQDTERRNIHNAPRKLVAALLGSKADTSRVHETVEPGQRCEPLMVQGDPDPLAWPKQGIWFVARESADAAPYECIKVADVPLQMATFSSLLETVILPDGRNRRLKAPLDIYWIACRATIRAGQSAVSAVANHP